MFDRQDLKLRLNALNKAQVVSGRENSVLEEIIESMLDSLEQEGRQPDGWEANCLHAALAALGKHRSGLARANLLHALETTRPHQTVGRPGVTLSSLRAELDSLRGLLAKGSLKAHGHGPAAGLHLVN